MRCANGKCSQGVEDERYRQCARCRKQKREAMQRHRERDPDASRAYMREFHERRRRNVLAHYGGVCACCGEARYEFLVLDHIDGGGNQHRAEVGSGTNMIGWAIQNDLPPIFRVLCHNCNSALGHYGYCPHEGGLRAVAGDE